MIGRSEDRILVIEDSDDDYDTILEAARRAQLRGSIIRAIDAEDGMRALRQARSGFDLLILDNNLPGPSGYELLLQIRSDPDLRRLPTVMFTTSRNPRECTACYEAGANAYHVKSVSFEECLRTISLIFQYWLQHAMLPNTGGLKYE